MKCIKFKESNVLFAQDQSEYEDLHAFRDRKGIVTSCWQMTIKERIKVLFTGRVWLSLMTFNKPIQPQLLRTYKPIRRMKGKRI